MLSKKYWIYILSIFILHYLCSALGFILLEYVEFSEEGILNQGIWIFFFLFTFPLFLVSKSADFIYLEKDFIFQQMIPICSITYSIIISTLVAQFDVKENKKTKIKKGFE